MSCFAIVYLLELVHAERYDPKIAGIEWEAIPPGPDAAQEDRWGLSPEQQGPKPGWFAITVNHIYEQRK